MKILSNVVTLITLILFGTQILEADTTQVRLQVETQSTSTDSEDENPSKNDRLQFVVSPIERNVSDTSAALTWTTNLPSKSIVRWGLTSEYEGGSALEAGFSKSHEALLSNLVPGARYYVHIGITSRDNHSKDIALSFVTVSEGIASSENVSKLKVVALREGIELSWANAVDGDAVRILRYEGFYPRDPLEGRVVYEGSGEYFLDKGVEEGNTYFYTVFTLTNGKYSSGAVGVAQFGQSGEFPTNPLDRIEDLFPNPVSTVIDRVLLEDFSWTQDGLILEVKDGVITMDAARPFILSLPSETLPNTLKTILVTLLAPNDHSQSFSAFLRLNEEGTAYESKIGPLNNPGTYPFTITILDYHNRSFKHLNGSVDATLNSQLMDLNLADRTFSVESISLLLGLVIILWFVKKRFVH